jgi:hypothetical protein
VSDLLLARAARRREIAMRLARVPAPRACLPGEHALALLVGPNADVLVALRLASPRSLRHS